MENVYGNFNYNSEFIEDLQHQISDKIAKLSNKKNSYRKYDFGDIYDANDILKLQTYSKILENIRACNPCFEGTKIEDVIQKIKALLNKLN